MRPDIMTVAKGLTSGYAPMGATIVARHVEDAFADAPLLHLNTYAGNPVACEAALATLDILRRERLPERAAELEPSVASGLAQLGDRTERLLWAAAIGLLSSVELDVSDHPDPAALLVEVRHEAYERGLIVRLAEAEGVLTIVLYPTLVASEDDVRSGTATPADVVVDKVGACVAVRDGRLYDRPR